MDKFVCISCGQEKDQSDPVKSLSEYLGKMNGGEENA